MVIDVRTLATANLAVQLVLIVFVFSAVYLARKGRVTRHCAIQRTTVSVQIVTILVVMLPSLLGYVQDVQAVPFLFSEMLIHHTLGLVLIGTWIYINLEVGRVIHPRVKRKNAMWFAFSVWMIAIALGVNIYLTIYTSLYT